MQFISLSLNETDNSYWMFKCWVKSVQTQIQMCLMSKSYFVCTLRFCLPSCIEVRAWLTICWLERRQFFSWAAALCGEEARLTELDEFTSGVEGRVEDGPGDPGDERSEILQHPFPPPPALPTGLDRHKPRVAPTPNGALERQEGGEKWL